MKPRQLLLNLHLVLGLGAGVIVLLFGLTGSVMAFENQLERWLHPHLSYVTPVGRPRPLEELAAAVTTAFPGDTVQGYHIGLEPDWSYAIETQRGSVAIDQYTGTILGVQTGEDWIGFIHQLHLRLHLVTYRAMGQRIMAWAGVVMLILLCSGLYLWWPVKRLTVSTGRSPRRTWYDIHNAAGALAFAALVPLTISGIVIGFERSTTPLWYRLTGSVPTRMPSPEITAPPNAAPIPPERALAAAEAALPGARAFDITAPGPREPYAVRLRFPEDRTSGGRSRALIDPYTGAVLFAEGSRTAPAGARAVILNRAIHTGEIFGWPSQLVMSLASLVAAAQVVSGFLLWRSRRRPEPA